MKRTLLRLLLGLVAVLGVGLLGVAWRVGWIGSWLSLPADAPVVADYPEADPALGEELYPQEAAWARVIADNIAGSLRRRPPGDVGRWVHRRAHGCVDATLEVLADLDPALARGVFQPGARYPAVVRFSPASPRVADSERLRGVQGMGIKLLDVPGDTLVAGDRPGEHDFLLVNGSAGFMTTPRAIAYMTSFNGDTGLGRLGVLLSLGRGIPILLDGNALPAKSGLTQRYWSVLAYKLGVGEAAQAVKYSAWPCDAGDASDSATELADDLAAAPACFVFAVQPRADASLSVEDMTTTWPEDRAPFHPVAELHIPTQQVPDPREDDACEALEFNPWRVLPEHRPLGRWGRLRKAIYEEMARVRHELDSSSEG